MIMHTNPILDELRRIRQAYSEQHAFDLKAIVDDLKLHEQQHADRLVSFPAKPPRSRKLV